MRRWVALVAIGVLCVTVPITARNTSRSPSSPPTSSGNYELAHAAGRAQRRCAHPAPDWLDVTNTATNSTDGYASVDSSLPGASVGLYISTDARRYRVDAYRMGYYGTSTPACEMWVSRPLIGRRQAPASVFGSVHEPQALWHRSLTVDTRGWRPGEYLFRINGGSARLRSFIPLTLRSPSMIGRTVLLMPDTTWQAYDSWGGYSLYYGPDHQFDERAREVSFDRPYDNGLGAADFIDEELPLVVLAEKLGIPLGYATDVDLQRNPAAVLHARAIISDGHDEYYSPTMRDALVSARKAGVNLGFFGANDVYRKIRFAGNRSGPDQLEINYKDDSDPIGVPSLVTTQWRDPPSDDPESSLTGESYLCSSPGYYPSIVVSDAGSWLFADTTARDGTVLSHVAGQEFDGIDMERPTPRPLDVLFHSPVQCRGHARFQDTVYYTTASGSGVLDIGAYYWVCAMANTCRVKVDPKAVALTTAVTANFLWAAAAGPLGYRHPATDNVSEFYPKPPHVAS